MSLNITHIETATKAKCVVSSKEVLKIANNKFLTCEWLKKNGMNYPHYAMISDISSIYSLYSECGFAMFAFT